MRQFWKAASRNFIQIGGLFPSTQVACQRIARTIPPNAVTVAEYGPGTGVLTKEILKRLPAQGKVFGIELNKDFAQVLGGISDPRFQLIHGDVAVVSAQFSELDARGIDVALSGIPFTFIPDDVTETIIRNTHESLKPGGAFIVYQYSRKVLPILKKYFKEVRVTYEPRNVFPYFIMKAMK